MSYLRALVLPVALGLSLGACGAPPGPEVPVETGKGDPMNQGLTYPEGPYGFVEGSVIANLQFLGRADDSGNDKITDDPVRTIHLSDFHNDKSMKVLLLMVAAEWCGPCRAEQFETIGMYQDYAAAKAGV